jgi:hypothetical protein
MQGHRDVALDRLRQAAETGISGVDPHQDPDLASLRGDPEFEELVARIQRNGVQD